MVELGARHECEECSTKFYDLGKPEIVCPKCGWNPDEPKSESADADGDAKGAKKKKSAKKKAGKKKAAKAAKK